MSGNFCLFMRLYLINISPMFISDEIFERQKGGIKRIVAIVMWNFIY